MAITTVLFDLDGTLLPMDQDVFVKAYFGGISKKVAPLGYEPDMLIKTIWAGTGAMIKNDGANTNEKTFWMKFSDVYGEKSLKDIPVFDDFYKNEFQKVKEVCGYSEKAAEVVSLCKRKGFRIVLATNPIFPKIATISRIRWAGLDPEDFEYYTSYENSHYCKPNPNYYTEILKKLDIKPEEALMVGNDVGEDMIIKKLGASVFLLTDCLINKTHADISAYPNGDFTDLIEYIENLQ